MSDYLFIETREPWESREVGHSLELAIQLARTGHPVTVFLAENGVLPARRGAEFPGIEGAIEAGVTVLADDFSLRERGIRFDRIRPGIAPSPLESVVDRLAAGCKSLWH